MTLYVDDLFMNKWWVDASYDVHEDCKGHTVAMVSLCKGAVTSFLIKTNIQCKSSTENELIGTYDAIPQALWSKYFIEV